MAKGTGEVERIRERAQSLLAEQKAIVRSLLRLRVQLGGSLIVRYSECGKEGCACRAGERHGPYFILSTRSGGKGGFSYLTDDQMACARDLVRRHRDFQEGFRRLRQVNQSLLAVFRRYRTATARQGARALDQVRQKVSYDRHLN
jgi:hypothetical protein